MRRTATAEDMKLGNVVYKGKGKTPWYVIEIIESGPYAGAVTVSKSLTGTGNAYYFASEFTVEA